MNSYKLNGIAGHLTRNAICEGLNITGGELYRSVKEISNKGIIEDKKGNKYKLKLVKQ
tara:strand:- start:2791 stop:2964 length:174 start_codon:yes stop_codon:yes gene_type:complete